MRRIFLAAGLLAVLVPLGCADDGGGDLYGALTGLYVTVDFEETQQAKANFTSQTPSRYEIKLCRLVLWNPTTNDRFVVFRHDNNADCPTYEFTAGTFDAMDMVPAGVELPAEPGYGVVEMDILYLEMDLDFYVQAANGFETRSLRHYLSSDGEYRPGDMAVIDSDALGDNWVFGDGNVTADPYLEGLPREQAYTLEEWPRGHSTTTWGPFGDAAFWNNHPPNPFTWAVALLPNFGESTVITFKVGETWNFTDQNQDETTTGLAITAISGTWSTQRSSPPTIWIPSTAFPICRSSTRANDQSLRHPAEAKRPTSGLLRCLSCQGANRSHPSLLRRLRGILASSAATSSRSGPFRSRINCRYLVL